MPALLILAFSPFLGLIVRVQLYQNGSVCLVPKFCNFNLIFAHRLSPSCKHDNMYIHRRPPRVPYEFIIKRPYTWLYHSRGAFIFSCYTNLNFRERLLHLTAARVQLTFSNPRARSDPLCANLFIRLVTQMNPRRI